MNDDERTIQDREGTVTTPGYKLWWACHWCDWEAPIRPRLFDRLRATREFNRHLRTSHPSVVGYRATLHGIVTQHSL